MLVLYKQLVGNKRTHGDTKPPRTMQNGKLSSDKRANLGVSSSLDQKPKKSGYVKKSEIKFTEQEDKQLLECVSLYGQVWTRISKLLMKSMV